jgi:hypothetical protein
MKNNNSGIEFYYFYRNSKNLESCELSSRAARADLTKLGWLLSQRDRLISSRASSTWLATQKAPTPEGRLSADGVSTPGTIHTKRGH